MQGSFKNFNTIEKFKSAETKKELFNQLVDEVRAFIPSNNSLPGEAGLSGGS